MITDACESWFACVGQYAGNISPFGVCTVYMKATLTLARSALVPNLNAGLVWGNSISNSVRHTDNNSFHLRKNTWIVSYILYDIYFALF